MFARPAVSPQPSPETDAGSPAPWRFGPVDGAIAVGLLALSLGICFPLALHYRQEAHVLDLQRLESARRSRLLDSTLKFLQARRATLTRLRRATDRYVADVETRPIVPWSTAINELSSGRPGGLWATRISADGPRFSVDVAAARPELVNAYLDRLRQSRSVDFAALPPGARPATRSRVVGRLMGD